MAIYLNKWCPIIQTDNTQQKCMQDNCALWNDSVKNCSINAIANSLQVLENRAE